MTKLRGEYSPRRSRHADGEIRAWYSRGYLPHRDEINFTQFITFRLADSVAQECLRQFEKEVMDLALAEQQLERRRQIEKWLDQSAGCCALQQIDAARCVQQILLHKDGEAYRMLAWVIMLNHVHVVIEPLQELGKIVQAWKSVSA